MYFNELNNQINHISNKKLLQFNINESYNLYLRTVSLYLSNNHNCNHKFNKV